TAADKFHRPISLGFNYIPVEPATQEWQCRVNTGCAPSSACTRGRRKRSMPRWGGTRQYRKRRRRRGRRLSGDLPQGADDLLGIARAHQARHFLAVAQEDQGGPQLDAERTPQRAAAAVLDLDMLHLRMRGESLFDERLRALAEAAPVRAELKHQAARAGVDVGARECFRYVAMGHGHGKLRM